MRFSFELCDDGEFQFFEKHKRHDLDLPTVEEAIEECKKLYPSETWYIAQICRPFDDTTLDQPIYDALNGFMFVNHNTVSNYRDLIAR